MDELIKVEQKDNEQFVNARDLHGFLEVGRDFTSWIKGRIEKYGFVENVDFTVVSSFHQNGGKGGRPQDDYIIKIDMAKELAMVENNDKGKQARRYFIECEKRLKNIATQSQQQRLYERSPQELLADNAIALNKMFTVLGLNIPKEIVVSSAITGTQNAIGYDFPEVKQLLNKQEEEVYHSASGILSKLNIKRNRTNETLALLGLQLKGTTTMQPWSLTELGKEYGVERTYTNGKHQGYEIKWKDTLLNYVKENIENIPNEFIK